MIKRKNRYKPRSPYRSILLLLSRKISRIVLISVYMRNCRCTVFLSVVSTRTLLLQATFVLLRGQCGAKGYNRYMELRDFETLITASGESQSLDYKGPCTWSKSLIKDILAMANVQDGGYLVFGFEDGSFARLGMTDEQIASFEEERIKDQVSQYADPYVEFSVFNDIVDANGKKFVVIHIDEFAEVPVICKKATTGIIKGAMYYRTKTSRPASEPISNAYELRDIMDRSAVKIMAKRRSQGYIPAEEPNNEITHYYEEELGGL